MPSPKPILFIDFDGTLCHDRYWRSLPKDIQEKIQSLIFGEDKTLVDGWMRGKYTAEEINQIVAKETGVPFDKLWEGFVIDCETMNVSKEVLEKIDNFRNKYLVLLITTNMDSFSRFTLPALGLGKYFDLIVNSFEEGKLKTDNEGETFKKYADKLGVNLKNCLLIDDSKRSCAVFQSLGGEAFRVTLEQDISYHLSNL